MGGGEFGGGKEKGRGGGQGEGREKVHGGKKEGGM